MAAYGPFVKAELMCFERQQHDSWKKMGIISVHPMSIVKSPHKALEENGQHFPTKKKDQKAWAESQNYWRKVGQHFLRFARQMSIVEHLFLGKMGSIFSCEFNQVSLGEKWAAFPPKKFRPKDGQHFALFYTQEFAKQKGRKSSSKKWTAFRPVLQKKYSK